MDVPASNVADHGDASEVVGDGTQAPAARLLSAGKGPMEATADEQSLLCYLDDGRLFVSEAHRLNPYVLAYQDRLRRMGRPFNALPSTPEQIAALYRDAAGGEADPGFDPTIVQEQVVSMLREATKIGASDIHVVNRHDTSVVRFRVNGVLEVYQRLRPKEGEAIAATIYQSMLDVAGDAYFKKNQPQDGRLKEEFVSSIGLYGARVATRPMERGHLTVMRLLYNTIGSVTLDQLGYLPEQVEMIRSLCRNKTGINILSGATGSGKSLSLKCSLELVLDVFDRSIHVLTIEDPPEYTINGAVQTPVIAGDWPGAISNAVRLDPDVLQIGELRDFDSATAGFRAAMTGHGVWTTLHANDTVSALERLKDMGVDLGLITDPALVTGLMNQSLVRKVCQHCSVSYAEGAAALDEGSRRRVEKYCDTSKVRLTGPGCAHCRNGSSGRTLVAEVVLPTLEFMEVFKTRGKNAAREYWLKEMGGITKTDHVIRRANEGVIDPLAAEKDIGYGLDRSYR